MSTDKRTLAELEAELLAEFATTRPVDPVQTDASAWWEAEAAHEDRVAALCEAISSHPDTGDLLRRLAIEVRYAREVEAVQARRHVAELAEIAARRAERGQR